MSAHVVTLLVVDVADTTWDTVIKGVVGCLAGAILLLAVCAFAVHTRATCGSAQAAEQAPVPTMQSSPTRDANLARADPVEPDPVLRNFSALEIKRLTALRRRYQAGGRGPALHRFRFLWRLAGRARSFGVHEQ